MSTPPPHRIRSKDERRLSNPPGVIPYHEASKHTPASIRYGSKRLDWTTKPNPFKQYLELAPIPLPSPAADTKVPTVAAISGAMGEKRDLNAVELSRLLTLAAGVSKVFHQPPYDPMFFRTYACAGALYPNEVYVACGGIDGVDPGLYHFSPAEDALRLLRAGDPRPSLLRATGAYPAVGAAPVSVILSGIPWRTAWKYKQRGYRHLFWDAGMILANLLALSASGGHPSEVVMGFEDAELNLLLGLDGVNEMSLCIVPIGIGDSEPAAMAPDAPGPIDHPYAKLSHWERPYSEADEAHKQTSIGSFVEAQLWHQNPLGDRPRPATASLNGIERTIRKRGSKRQFKQDPILIEELAGVLDCANHKLNCDWGEGLAQVGLIAHGVEDLESGAYAYVYGFDRIALGDFREKGRYLCLEQALGGDGAATIFILTDLAEASTVLGPRSYRAAQLEAGIVAGRIYLGSYACGFGATGLTFYDDEVRTFFQTEAEPMIAVALGH